MRSRASLVTETSVAEIEISVTVMKIFPYEHSSPVSEMKLFYRQGSYIFATQRTK